MKRSLVICAISFWFGFLGVATSAAVVVSVDTNNMVTGIEDLVIEGMGTYNIDFIWDSYAAIWGSGFAFDTPSSAQDAVDAVCDALDNWDPSPVGVAINELETALQFLVPYEINNTVVSSKAAAVWLESPGTDWYSDGNTQNRNETESQPYAVFSSVPIPGAIWLLGSGLISIVGVRRKLKK